jgi:hypothetical protein
MLIAPSSSSFCAAEQSTWPTPLCGCIAKDKVTAKARQRRETESTDETKKKKKAITETRINATHMQLSSKSFFSTSQLLTSHAPANQINGSAAGHAAARAPASHLSRQEKYMQMKLQRWQQRGNVRGSF